MYRPVFVRSSGEGGSHGSQDDSSGKGCSGNAHCSRVTGHRCIFVPLPCVFEKLSLRISRRREGGLG